MWCIKKFYEGLKGFFVRVWDVKGYDFTYILNGQPQTQNVPFASSLQLIKKETLALVFSCEFCEIFKSTFFKGHFQETASAFVASQWPYCSSVSGIYSLLINEDSTKVLFTFLY